MRNRINYLGVVTTPSAELQTVKLHLNSVISDVKTSYTTADIKNFNLNTPMHCYEHLRIPVQNISDDIMQQYQLQYLVINAFIMVEIRKGVYELPRADIITNNQLQKHLTKLNYFPS